MQLLQILESHKLWLDGVIDFRMILLKKARLLQRKKKSLMQSYCNGKKLTVNMTKI